jgi:Aldose 1-epimerase
MCWVVDARSSLGRASCCELPSSQSISVPIAIWRLLLREWCTRWWACHSNASTLFLQQELLFTSRQAIFAPPKAIRGGIPLCFPQFGDMGSLKQQHGFARNSAFTVQSLAEDSVSLLLNTDLELKSIWGFSFELLCTVRI